MLRCEDVFSSRCREDPIVSAGTVEYNNCVSVEENESPNECPGDDKKSKGETPVLEFWVI